MIVIEQIVTGVLLGGMYALFASGLTLSLGVMSVFNVAYGAILSLAAILTVRLMDAISHPSIALALLAGAIIGAGLSVLLEVVAVRPLRKVRLSKEDKSHATMITTLAFLLIFGAYATWYTGAQPERFPNGMFTSRAVSAFGVTVRSSYVLGATVGVVVILILWLIVTRTQIGRNLRATAVDPSTAELLGVNVNRLGMASSAAAGAMAGLAGVLLGFTYGYVDYNLGNSLLTAGFVVVVLGGLGSIIGTLIGGVLLGVTEALISYYSDGRWTPLAAGLLITIFLVARPQGVLGTTEVDRA